MKNEKRCETCGVKKAYENEWVTEDPCPDCNAKGTKERDEIKPDIVSAEFEIKRLNHQISKLQEQIEEMKCCGNCEYEKKTDWIRCKPCKYRGVGTTDNWTRRQNEN